MSSGHVKSAMRVFAILELFEKEQRRLKVSEIVEALDYPQSSVSTLMKTLQNSGYVSYHADERSFSPAPQLAFLGHWSLGHRDSVEILHGVMRQLSDATGESAVLGARNGILMQYISFIVAESGIAFRVTEGTMRPMHKSALGLMLMSQMDDSEVGKIVRRYHLEYPEHVPDSLADVLNNVRFARENGYFMSRNIMTTGASVISALIPTPPNARRLAIGVAGPTERIHKNAEENLRQVRIAMREYHKRMTELRDRHY